MKILKKGEKLTDNDLFKSEVIKTFAIFSFVENPIGCKSISEKEFKDKFIRWFNDKKRFNEGNILFYSSEDLKNIILKNGETGLKYSGIPHTTIKGFCERNENTLILFNLSLEDAKTLANSYGQESFFYGILSNDKSTISYYASANLGKTYYQKDAIGTIKTFNEVKHYFSKFGFNWEYSLKELETNIPKINNMKLLSETTSDKYTFKGRASWRRRVYK